MSELSRNHLKFDVGDQLFSCHQSTLEKFPDSILAKEAEKYLTRGDPRFTHIFFDRNGKYFEDILNFMRDPNTLDLNQRDLDYAKNLMKEATYYNITQITECCKKHIDRLEPTTKNHPPGSFDLNNFIIYNHVSDLLDHLGRRNKIVYLLNRDSFVIRIDKGCLAEILGNIDESLLDVYGFQGAFPGLEKKGDVATLLYDPSKNLILASTSDTLKGTQYLIIYFVQKLIRQRFSSAVIAEKLHDYIVRFTEIKKHT